MINNNIYKFLIFISCSFKLLISSYLPFVVSYYGSHDTRWFFEKASSFSSGDWMGESYNHYTLIKLQVYPIFLSLVSNSGLSTRLIIDMLYIIASLIFLKFLNILVRNQYAAFFGFFIVLMNPVTFSIIWSAATRENLYLSLVLMFLSSIGIIIVRLSKNNPNILIWSLLAGLSFGLAYHTREEGIWMVPILLVSLLISSFYLYKASKVGFIILNLIFFLSPSILMNHEISKANQERYGYYGTIDVKAPGYTRAYDAVLSLNTSSKNPYHYFTQETKDKLLVVSESTKELIVELIDESGEYKHYDVSIKGAHASWAFRSAMNKNGYYSSFEKVENQYNKIADDIERYCSENVGQCKKLLISKLFIADATFSRFVTKTKEKFTELVNFRGFDERMDETESKYSFDSRWRYSISKFFNIPVQDINKFNKSLPELVERKQLHIEIQNQIHSLYAGFTAYLLLFSTVMLIFLLFKLDDLGAKLVLLGFFGSLVATFFMYLIVSMFAVSTMYRVVATSTIPMLCFNGLILAVCIEKFYNAMIFQFNSVRLKK